MLYIGIDLGTSAVKLLLMRTDGTIEKIVSKEYPISFPHPGWSEQNPSDWWEACVAGIRELTADADKSQVAGISFGGQMHGLVALDEKDEVLRPAILWNDGRTMEETEYLNETIGKEKLSQYTANIAFAGFTAPKLLWMTVCPDIQNHASERLYRIQADRRTLHRRIGCFWYASDGCGKEMLVKRNDRNMRNTGTAAGTHIRKL